MNKTFKEYSSEVVLFCMLVWFLLQIFQLPAFDLSELCGRRSCQMPARICSFCFTTTIDEGRNVSRVSRAGLRSSTALLSKPQDSLARVGHGN